MRTRVEPSSMAISKSPDMPMESSWKSMPGYSRARVSRSERNRRKQARAVSGFSSNGAMVISPCIVRCSRVGIRSSRCRSSTLSGSMPDLAGSPLILISSRIGSLLPSLPAASFRRSASRKESTLSMAEKNLGSASRLVRLQMPDEVNFRAGDAKLVKMAPLGVEFLHAILAEERQARVRRLGQRLGRMHFGDTHQPHLPGGAACAMARCRDALFHALQPFSDRTHTSIVGEADWRTDEPVPAVTFVFYKLS